MNASLLSKMKNIFVILFILSLSFPIKAQDTIHCYDSRYYWNNEYCGIIQSIETNNPEVTVGLTMNSMWFRISKTNYFETDNST